MRRFFTSVLLSFIIGLTLSAPGDELSFNTHQEAAHRLIELLVDTEACLATCTDADSVQAALPRLRELAQRAQDFKTAQNALHEPTTQDYMAAQELLEDFHRTWKAIRSHISRLDAAGLITPELRDILHLSPR